MKSTLMVVAVLAAGITGSLAAQEPAPPAAPRLRQRPAGTKPDVAAPAKVQASYQNTITFVSADARARTVTFVDVESDRQTWAVEGQALTKLGQFKDGQKLIMTWRTNEKGEPVAIIDLAPAPPPSPRPAATRRQGSDSPPHPGALVRPETAAEPPAAPSPAMAPPVASPTPSPRPSPGV
jgi:hypothetical protein